MFPQRAVAAAVRRAVPAAGRQRRWKKSRYQQAVHEHYRLQAPGLPIMDPFGAEDFDPDRIRSTDDRVYGNVGLVARRGGFVTTTQLENALEVVEDAIERKGLKGVQAVRRDLGKEETISRTTLVSRLPAEIRQRYTGNNGTVAFRGHTVLAGTVLLEVWLQEDVATARSRQLVQLLYSAAAQIGLVTFPAVRGRVSDLDDMSSETSFWHDRSNNTLFTRGQDFTPETTLLLSEAKGTYQLGDPLPRPKYNPRKGATPTFADQREARRYSKRYASANENVPRSVGMDPQLLMKGARKWKAKPQNIEKENRWSLGYKQRLR